MKKLLTFLALVATATLGLSQGRNISINPATKKLIYPLPADAAALGEINALAYLKPNDTAAQDTNKTGMLAMMAFAATRSASGGTAFFIPDGVYNINCDFTGSVINVPSNTSIRMGKACKLVVDNNGSTERYTVFRFLSVDNCSISGGEIVGDRTTVLAGSNYGFGIALQGTSSHITIKDVIIRDCHLDGLYIESGTDYNVSGVEIYNSRRSGCSITDGQRMSFYNCRFSGSNGPEGIEAGLDIETQAATDVTDVSFFNCQFDANGTDGLNIQKGSGAGIPKRISVTHCSFTSNAGTGVLNFKGEDISLVDCESRLNTGDNFRLDSILRGEIIRCTTNAGNRGIYLLRASSVTLEGNTILSPADDGIGTADNDPLFPLTNIRIHGNVIQDSGGFGVDFRGSYSSLSENFVNRTQQSGIISVGINNKIENNQVFEAGLVADNTVDAVSISGFGHTIASNTIRKCAVSQTGTATAGGASTITLPATRSVLDDILNGYKITITAGTGSGQTGTISDYVGATGVVTVSAPWGVAPDNTSVYEVIPSGNQQRYGLITICDRAQIMGNDDYLGGKTGASLDAGTNTDTGISSDIGVATGTSLTLSGGLTFNSGYIQGPNLYATTGNIDIGADARATNVVFRMNAASTRSKYILYMTGGVSRWTEGASTEAEAGSDTGSDWDLTAYTDAGAFIDKPVVITRAAGGTIALSRPTTAPSFSGDGSNLTSIAASNITGPFSDISMTGTLTREGAQILTATTSGGTVIDTSKARSERTITADTTFTFSAAPPTGSQFSVALTADTVDRAITIPSSYSFEAGGAVTVFTQRANQHLLLGFIRLASSYQVIGIPVADILGSTITLAEGGSTATPAAATSKVYVKADGLWYGKDDAGVETALSNVAGGGAPTTATYITQTADAGLSAEQAMGALATGIVKNTTTTGVQSIAVAGTDYAGLASANAFTAAQGITLVNAQTQTNTITGMGTTPVPGLQVTNTTAAAAGAQQVSPSIRWTGQGWKTDATAASRSVEFRSYVLPIQSTANPTGNWMLETSINGGAWGPVLTIGSVGAITMASGQTITAGNLDVGATGFMEWVGRSYMQSPADGQIVMKNQAGTAMLLQLAGTTASFPGIARATEYVNIVDATGGTTGGLQINSGTPLLGLLSASAAIDFASMLTGAEDTQTITVTGVATTNTPSVELGWSASLEAGISVSQAWVSGANTVSIRVRNSTVGTIDPASLTARATVSSF